MILFFSGGSALAECYGKDPAVMLSFYVVVNKSGRPDARLRRLTAARAKAKKRTKK